MGGGYTWIRQLKTIEWYSMREWLKSSQNCDTALSSQFGPCCCCPRWRSPCFLHCCCLHFCCLLFCCLRCCCLRCSCIKGTLKGPCRPKKLLPYSALPMHPSRLIQKGYQVSRASSAEVLSHAEWGQVKLFFDICWHRSGCVKKALKVDYI